MAMSMSVILTTVEFKCSNEAFKIKFDLKLYNVLIL